MYCPNCGRELPHNDFAKCPHCGAPLSASAVDNAPTVGPQGQIVGQLPPNYTGGNAQTVLSKYGQAPAAPGQPAPNAPAYAPPPSGPAGRYPYPQPAPNPANQPYAPANSGAARPSTPLTPPLTPPSYAQGYGQGYGQAPTVASAPNGPGYGPPGYPPSQPSPQGPQRRQLSLPLIIISSAILVAVIVALIVGVIKLIDRGGTTSQTHNTPTATAPAATATPSANILFQDALISNTHGWFDDGSHCFFKSDGYHIKLSYFCVAPTTIPEGNITVSVNVKEVSGSNDFPFGIVLRRSGQQYYAFEIDSQSQWVFFKATSASAKDTTLHTYTTNAAIHKGLNVANALKVVIRGNVYACYVNNTLVGQVTDSSYSSGQVGLISEKYEAVFTDMLVTQP